MMGDLERLDGRKVEGGGDSGLGIGREQQVEVANAQVGDDRTLVRILAGVVFRRLPPGPQDAQREWPGAQELARVGREAANAAAGGGGHHGAVQRGRGAIGAVEHQADRKPVEDTGRPAIVIGLRVRDHEQVDPTHSGRAQALGQGRARRSRVDEDGGAAVLDQGRVALADIEERDDDIVRIGRVGHALLRAGRGAQPRDGDRHGDHRGPARPPSAQDREGQDGERRVGGDERGGRGHPGADARSRDGARRHGRARPGRRAGTGRAR